MSRKIDSLKRIADLQRQIRDLEKWRLLRVESEKRTLDETRRDVLAATEREFASFGPVADLATRRLRRLDVEVAVTELRRETQEREVLRHAARSKAIDRAFEKAAAEKRSVDARKELGEIVDAWQAGAGSSPA